MKTNAISPSHRKRPVFLPWDDLERIYRQHLANPEAENQMTRAPARVLFQAGLATLVREKNRTTVFVKITAKGCQAYRERQDKLQAIASAELTIDEQGQEPLGSPIDLAQNMQAKKKKGVFAA